MPSRTSNTKKRKKGLLYLAIPVYICMYVGRVLTLTMQPWSGGGQGLIGASLTHNARVYHKPVTSITTKQKKRFAACGWD